MATITEQDVFWEAFNEMENEWVQEHSTKSAGLNESVDDFIIDAIAEALKDSAGNRTHAAKKLGISRECLIYKIKKYF